MAFVWDENIAPGQDILASNVNEVQDNIDTIYATLDLTRPGCASGAGWTEFPIAGLTAMLPAQPQQLRDAIDYAHENPCPAYNNVYQDGVDTTEDTGYNDGYLAGADTTYNPGYYNNQHGTYKTGEDSTYNSGHLLGVDSDHYTDYQSAYKVPD